MIVRVLAGVLGLVALAAGGYGAALAHAPKHDAVKSLRKTVKAEVKSAGFEAKGFEAALAVPQAYGLLVLGVLGVGLAVRPRRRGESEVTTPGEETKSGVDARIGRKVRKQASSMARKGQVSEAAELCFQSGLLDEAVEHFEQAGELTRVAEIRHDQNRVDEAADIYVRAGDLETAGRLYGGLGDHGRAADCYSRAGKSSVAAEMYEQAGQHLKAAKAYQASGFHRHAAQAYLRVEKWVPAAQCLEEVAAEEAASPGAQLSPERQQELRKIVLQAGKLYERADDLQGALRVLEKGGCFAAAAEVAQRLSQHAKAAELFLAANDPPRAAEALLSLGEQEAASRILGEYHRDRNEDAEAARYFLEAGDHLQAGDLFRRLERLGEAAECYEKAGDRIQAAEMFEAGGQLERAAENYEHASQYERAAGCWEQLGNHRRHAELLERAGQRLRSGHVYHAHDLDDEAIKVLQRIGPEDVDFGPASAVLGEIFHTRGQHGLAIAKVKQAIGNAELETSNVAAYYRLATIHEENNELVEAVAIYERILAFDYHYEDVDARLGGARERLALMTSARSVSGGGSTSQSLPPQASCSGRYQIQSELGRGGMGIVYKAQDSVLDRPVAFKVLPDAFKENPQALRNFLREAKSAAKLNHPNIVTVYDAGEQDGVYYIAMEYVDGTTLKEIVRKRGAISENGVLHVLVQMCEALRYAHQQRVVHRDVKTANTMWTRDKKAKIMDFGLAKVVEEVRNHTTMVAGTPYYMSPEQTLGKNIDHRTDLYSLGVTVFELCSGTLPFREGNVPYHHVHTPPPDVRELHPETSPLLAEIIGRCMQKDPDARFQDAGEILAELKAKLPRRS